MNNLFPLMELEAKNRQLLLTLLPLTLNHLITIYCFSFDCNYIQLTALFLAIYIVGSRGVLQLVGSCTGCLTVGPAKL